jgi:hypothetical protein
LRHCAASRKVAVSIPDVVVEVFIDKILPRIKERIEVTGRRGRRCRKLLDDLKEGRGYSRLKEEALVCTMWTAHFRRGFGLVLRPTAI